MAKRKKTRTQKKESSIARARNWLPAYEGTHIVRAYRKKFHVNTVCAVRELQDYSKNTVYGNFAKHNPHSPSLSDKVGIMIK